MLLFDIIGMNGTALRQQLNELKVKTHALRNELVGVKRMQQTLQESFKMQLECASKKIEVCTSSFSQLSMVFFQDRQ